MPNLSDPVRMLERACRFNEGYARILVQDLSPAQMTACPGPGHENHPAFTLGHLVCAADMMTQDLGGVSDLPAGWEAMFARRGPSDRRLPEVGATYPGAKELLAELTRQHDRWIAALTGVVEREPGSLLIEETWKLSAHFPMRWDSQWFMATSHAAMYLGQLAAWRRAMGLPAAMAQM